MCTVSFIQANNKIFLTSSRDEQAARGTATFPCHIASQTCSLLFPKDSKAGGSWISLCSNSNAGVLLNGAFENHERKEHYRKSRGLIFLEIMDHAQPLTAFQDISLEEIEPFTLIIRQQNELYECRWDGAGRYVLQKDQSKAHIWSSVTLYNKSEQERKEQLFFQWLNSRQVNLEEVLHFHEKMQKEKTDTETVSISCVEMGKSLNYFTYLDLQKSSRQRKLIKEGFPFI